MLVTAMIVISDFFRPFVLALGKLIFYSKMSFEQRCPIVLLCCGAFNPITVGHVKMFEIARNFLERTGNHIVISGVISPVHDNFDKSGLISSTHRIAMCKSAVKKHSWLSVDTWECSQNDWLKILKVLQHIANKIKNDYGVPGPYSSPIYYSPARYPRNTVTLQPDGKLKTHFANNRLVGTGQTTNGMSSPVSKIHQDENVELNEASELDHNGVVFDRLSINLKKVCCVRPVPPALSDNMVYGAAYDLRRTKVMLLCGSDILESFGVPGLWTDKDIEEIVSQYGIVCIPRSMESSESSDGKLMRDAFDRLQKVLNRVKGTVILVNDQNRMEISDVSSTKCRTALKSGKLDNIRHFLNPDVLHYARDHSLYVEIKNELC